VGGTNGALAATTLGNTLTRSGHTAVEVHSVNTDRRVVLDTEIDVFADTETKVASLGEVALTELIFLDLQSTLQDFLSLWSTDGNVHRDLFVTADTEGSDSVAGLACEEYMSAPVPRDAIENRRHWKSYCRQEFDHSIVPTPWRHE
jgi:hypothetical protein